MTPLLTKAALVYGIFFAVLALSYGAGYAFGALKWVAYESALNSSVIRFSREMEYKVPGYRSVLRSYKAWHDRTRTRCLSDGTSRDINKLIFFNNWIVTNLILMIRAAFVLPLGFSVFERFYQGVILATTPGSGRTTAMFLLEFGGYTLTTCSTACLTLWIMFPVFFDFAGRLEGLIGGLKLVGLAYAVSGIVIAIGSWIEAEEFMQMLGRKPARQSRE